MITAPSGFVLANSLMIVRCSSLVPGGVSITRSSSRPHRVSCWMKGDFWRHILFLFSQSTRSSNRNCKIWIISNVISFFFLSPITGKHTERNLQREVKIHYVYKVFWKNAIIAMSLSVTHFKRGVFTLQSKVQSPFYRECRMDISTIPNKVIMLNITNR